MAHSYYNPTGFICTLPEDECKRLLLIGDDRVAGKHIEYNEGKAHIYAHPPRQHGHDDSVDAIRYALKQRFKG